MSLHSEKEAFNLILSHKREFHYGFLEFFKECRDFNYADGLYIRTVCTRCESTDFDGNEVMNYLLGFDLCYIEKEDKGINFFFYAQREDGSMNREPWLKEQTWRDVLTSLLWLQNKQLPVGDYTIKELVERQVLETGIVYKVDETGDCKINLIQNMDENDCDVMTIKYWAYTQNRIAIINKLVDDMTSYTYSEATAYDKAGLSYPIKFLKNTQLPYYVESAINRIVADKMLSATEKRLMEFFGKDTPNVLYNILLYINTDEQKLNHIIDLVESAISKRDKEVSDYFRNLVYKWESNPNNPYNDPEYHWRNANGYDAAIENMRKMASQYVGSPYVEDDDIPPYVLSDINLLIQEW